MRTDKTIGELIGKRGEKGLPLERVYKLLFNKNLYLQAYGKIYRNKGALTHAVTDETPDGMSLEKIDAIIEALRYERYQWLPVRRTSIPKKNGKKRPLGNGRDIHIEELGCRQRGVAPIASLPRGTESRPFRASEHNVVGRPDPIDLARGETASQSRTPPLLIELSCDLRRGVSGSQFTHPSHHLRVGAACIGHSLGSSHQQVRQRLRLPPDTHVNSLLPFGEGHILDEIAQQLFALGLAGRRGIPHSWHIVGERENALPLLGRQEQGGRLGQRGIFPL